MKEDYCSTKRERAFISPARTFLFNADKLEFIVGNSETTRAVKLSEIKDIGDIDRATFELMEKIEPNDQDRMLLMSTVCDLIELPAFRRRLISLNESENKLLCEKVEGVIKNVYYKVAKLGKPTKLSKRAKTGSIYSFSASIKRNGTFHLTTLGEYSALGTGDAVRANSVTYGSKALLEEAWENPSLPMEYQLHNADRENAEAKRISLYAGAGAMAWLVTNSPISINKS